MPQSLKRSWEDLEPKNATSLKIIDIPNDVLYLIFDQVLGKIRTPFLEQLKPLKSVCKKFLTIADRLEGKRLIHRFQPTLTGFKHFSRIESYVKFVQYINIPKGFLVLPSCPEKMLFVNCEDKIDLSVTDISNLKMMYIQKLDAIDYNKCKWDNLKDKIMFPMTNWGLWYVAIPGSDYFTE